MMMIFKYDITRSLKVFCFNLILPFSLSIMLTQVQAAPIVLKIGHGAAQGNHMTKAWEYFKQQIEKESKNGIQVQLFPAGQMGGDRELIEFVQSGTLDISSPTASVLAGWDKAFAASETPYLFSHREQAQQVLQGEFGQFLFTRLEPMGLMGIGWLENGWRQLSNAKRPIYTPDDLRGLKIRTMQVDAHILAFKTLGANPTPMAFGEVYSALQQGVIDGQENVLSNAMSSRVYEVNRYFSLTQHVYSAYIVLMNPDKYASLSTEQQQLLSKILAQTVDYQNQLIREEESSYVALLTEKGAEVNVLTPEQKQLFMDKLKPIMPQLEKGVDALVWQHLNQAIKAYKPK